MAVNKLNKIQSNQQNIVWKSKHVNCEKLILFHIRIAAGLFCCYWLHCLLRLNWFQNAGFKIGINKAKMSLNKKCVQLNNTGGVWWSSSEKTINGL